MEENKKNSDRVEIAKRLRKARILAGLSQAHCAEKLDMPRPSISEIEAGRRKLGE